MKTNFEEQLKKLPFLKIVLFYGIGIGIANFFEPNKSMFNLLEMFLVFSFLSHLVFFFYRSHLGILFTLNGYLILLFFGIWNIWRTHVKVDINHFLIGSSDQYIAVVDEEPVFYNNTVRFPVTLVAKRIDSSFQKAAGRLMVTLLLDQIVTPIQYGDEMVLKNKVKPIPEPLNPLEFNYRNYLQNQGIDGQVYLKSKEYKIIRHHQGFFIKDQALELRKNLVSKFKKYLKDEESYQIAVALIVGYRAVMSQDIVQTFSNTGTIHVLSVSGMHVGIVFIVLMWLLARVSGNHTLNLLRIVILLCAIWSYTILTGMAPSILRAAIMLSFFLIAKSMQRENNMLNTMASSAFLLLLLQPSMLFDIGFQLSYFAVLGIVLFFPLFKRLSIFGGNRFSRIIWDSVAISLSAQIMTAPFSLFYFGQFPNYFLIANLLVVLPVTLIMYIGMAMMFIPFDIINAWLGSAMDWLIKKMFFTLEFLDQLPFATWTGIVFSPALVLISLVFLFSCSYAFYWKNRVALYMSVCFLLIGLSTFSYLQYLQFNYTGFRIYSTRKEIALAFIQKSNLTIVSSFDSLDARNLVYSAKRDLSRFTKWEDIDFLPLISYDSVRTNYLIQKPNLTIQIMEHSLLCHHPTDILLVRKNSKWNFIENVRIMKPKIVLFDGTNSDFNIQAWREQLDSMGVPHYSIKNNFAYVWDKELL
jgi:competence protein ComEC